MQTKPPCLLIVLQEPLNILLFAAIALNAAFFITRGLAEQPGYTDAYYYYNAAARFASGDGLTDAYLWTYIGLPDDLPTASHRYWMPLTSLIAALGMGLTDTIDYSSAQIPFALMLIGLAGTGFWLGKRLGGGWRHAWVAGLVTLFNGFFVRYWGMTDTFTPYGVVGSLALVFTGLSLSNISQVYRIPTWFIAGIFAGLGHLARADGLLLLLIALFLIGIRRTVPTRQRIRSMLWLLLGYLLVMMPWFLRSVIETGSPLPVGGVQAIWYIEYDALFNYPPGANLSDFTLSHLIESRWTAIINNLGTFIAVEGLVIMAPLMLIGLWNRRRHAFLQGFIWYALGLHVVMTFIFAYPGFRGGLFHSAAALVPFWAALGVCGVDDAVDWIAQRRKDWTPAQTKIVFSIWLVGVALLLAFSTALPARVVKETPTLYTQLQANLPGDARVMINDPAALYYFTGLGGVVLPNASPDVIPEIATKYGIDYVLIETIDGIDAVPDAFRFDLNDPPSFLDPVPIDLAGARLYAINQ